MEYENLKALVFGRKTTPYQRALALREFKDMSERLELLESVKNEKPLAGSKCVLCGGSMIVVENRPSTWICPKCDKLKHF